MVIAVNFENAHLYGDVLPEMFRLRHREFVGRQDYSVPTYKDMEYDAYDTPATTYLLWRDKYGKIWGTSRKAPTDRAYMIRDIWPQLITQIPMPQSAQIWESSRFCVDSSLDPKIRRRIVGDLVCAGLEFGIRQDVSSFIGVMPPLIWKYVFTNSGWPVEHIGEVTRLSDGSKVVAARMPVSLKNLRNVRDTMGIRNTVLAADPLDVAHTLNSHWSEGLIHHEEENVVTAQRKMAVSG